MTNDEKVISQAMKLLGSRGGKADSEAQKAARSKNAESARKAKQARHAQTK